MHEDILGIVIAVRFMTMPCNTLVYYNFNFKLLLYNFMLLHAGFMNLWTLHRPNFSYLHN